MASDEFSSWARDEFGHAMLSDRRHIDRAVAIAAQLASRPHSSLAHVFPNPNDLQGACRFLVNDDIEVEDLLTARHEACARRIASDSLVVCPLDGSSWRFTDRAKNQGTGPIGTHTSKARGLKVMTCYALRLDGVPMGLLAEQVWARPETSSDLTNAERALEDKESFWWTELTRRAMTVVETCCRKPPTLWFQLDAEGDQVSVLLQAHAVRERHFVTVRVNEDRLLAACQVPRLLTPKGETRESKLSHALESADWQGKATLQVRRRGQRARQASLEVHATSVTVRLREASSRKKLGDVPLTVVRVREVTDRGRGGEEPIEWKLYTTYPVRSFAEAMEVVRCYALRWRIERHHYTTKTGALGLPASQLRSFQARRKWIAMSTSVSGLLQHRMYRSRTEPDVSAQEEFSPLQIEAVACVLRGRRMKVPFASVETATLKQMMEGVARLGGYQGAKRSGGPPGVVTLTRGWEQMEVASMVLESLRAGTSPHGASDETDG